MKEKMVRHYTWNFPETFKGRLPKTWRWETSECDSCGSERRYKTYRSWRLIKKLRRGSINYDTFLTSTVKEYAKVMARQMTQKRPALSALLTGVEKP